VRLSRDGITSWPARLRRAAWPAGLLLGLGAEWLASPDQSVAAAAADLAVGWTLIGCGLTGWSRRPQSSVGPLLALAGFAWFGGTLAGSRSGAVAAIGSALLFVHRGPLCHAIIGYPSGRPASRVGWVALAVCYVCALVVPLARNDLVTIGVAAVVLAGTIWGYVRASGPDRLARTTAVVAAVVLAIPLASGSVLRLMGAGPGANRAILGVYQAALVLIAAGFLASAVRGRWAQGAVTKLVVDLGGDSEAGTLRARLANALGDRSLVIGYWLPEAKGYVDERGNDVVLPEAGSGKAVIAIDHDGERIAALVHDATVLSDPGLADSVAQAAGIVLSNVRLQVQVQHQIAEVEASRRRILAAADAQRRRLQQQLEAGAGRHLAGVRGLLDEAVQEARTSRHRTASGDLESARSELDEAQAELRELAAGIHPPLLTEQGLGPALASLAERAPLPVRLSGPRERLPADIETAVYFACSEALTNIAKHARASGADVGIHLEEGEVTVLIADDGTGGAEPAAGSGLKGVADRIEALGGRLQINSPVGRGTRLLAGIPIAPAWPASQSPKETPPQP
jgi:signal transduction histidine kinase